MHNDYFTTIRVVIKLFLEERYSSALRLLEEKIKIEENYGSYNLLKLMSAIIRAKMKDYTSTILILDEISDVIEPDRAKKICNRVLQICSRNIFDEE